MVNLSRLLSRGDVIEVLQGQLIITPKSGMPVPSSWLQVNQNSLLEQISRAVHQPIYQFIQFKVGRYVSRYDGLTMSFTDLRNHEDYFTIFNVSLDRKKKSGRLNGKRFNPPAQGALLKFWNCSNLPKARRPSELYKKINIMKNYLWQAEIRKGNKLDSKTLCLVNITHQQIFEAVNRGVLVTDKGQSSGTSAAPSRGNIVGHVNGAFYSGSKDTNSHIYQGLEARATTSIRNYGYCESRTLNSTEFHNQGISKQGSAVEANAISPTIDQVERTHFKRKPQDQSTAEWLHEYDNAKP